MKDAVRTVLVVDDDAAVRSSLRDFLEDQDYRVATAEDGNDILRMLARTEPDCVLLDLRMPGKSGLETIKDIRAVNAELPIIVISGQGQMEDVIDAIRAGAWDFITKPVIDLGLVTNRIRNALDRVQLADLKRRYQVHLEREVQERTRESEIRAAELETALHEKNALLNEIHHRVKNNMQIINSFISLSELTDLSPTCRMALEALKNRIQVMTLIHEIVSDRDRLTAETIKEMIVSIAIFLSQSYRKIGVEIAVDSALLRRTLSVGDAAPLGILISELLSIAFEHNFPENSGHVAIAIADQETEGVKLDYSDDGLKYNSYTENGVARTENDSIRQMVIAAVTRQLRGRLEVAAVSVGNRLAILISTYN